jgi:(1->4)-alpha-D-glucan 1-alpha-D-glucosylmutase
MTALRATARLQFHHEFRLDDAIPLVPYFQRLGISHIYASPLLKARAGSMHGYDVVDPTVVNPELGGEPALRHLVAALRQHDMGLILDIVPNHMGVGGDDNPWWLDLLEWGRASPYAEFFDIDWDPPDGDLHGRVLAPFLGSAYGDCLSRGELVLAFDEADGRLVVNYFSHRFPLAPRDYAAVLAHGGDALAEAARQFAAVGPATGGARETARARAAAARETLRAPALRPAIETAVAAYQGDNDPARERLHRLLERQAYRLAWWRAAADEINWRRFFDVNGLAGIRAELPAVFDASHATVLRLYAEGLIDGLRIDHVDGLAEPRNYCRKLRRKLQTAGASRPPGLDQEAPVIWVEKILAPHERLPLDWQTDGTTGYDFMNDVAGVLHDPAGEAALTHLWTSLTGRPGDFEDEARPARRQILRDSLASELLATAVALHRIGQRHLATRDWTLTTIHRALAEILVHFPAYRIYSNVGGIAAADEKVMDWAFAGAGRTIRAADRGLLDLVRAWLSGTDLRSVPAGGRRQERVRAMVRFQQLSAPTAAKSVEDTAFYRYGRLLSRNEVGTEPSQFAVSPSAFHLTQAMRQKNYRRALLATATHDHKRGEDTRMRLAVLSEIPEEWEAALTRWMRLNAPLRRDIDGPAPDAADEIMLYQMLVAAWPIGLAAEDRAGVAALVERLQGWQQKALREAKRKSGWAAPDEPYEQACQNFLSQMLDPERPARVAQEIAAFAARIAPAGALNGLAQTLLRLTSPGVPDLYQGSEFWDLSLVDPDNRRPIDFLARETALAAARPMEELIGSWPDGRVKQALIARVLNFRRRSNYLFSRGSYQKLTFEGPQAEHVLGFVRIHEGRAALTLVSRLAAKMPGVADRPLVHSEAWGETSILLPRNLASRRMVDVFAGDHPDGAAAIPQSGHKLLVQWVLKSMPVALLEIK